MYYTFSKEPLHIGDFVVYLKNEKTGSSTTRKCKFTGRVVEFTNTKVKILRLSPPDVFIEPEEMQSFGIDVIYSDEVVDIIYGKHDKGMVKTLEQVNNLVYEYKTELEFTRKFIYEHGLEFELASAWNNA